MFLQMGKMMIMLMVMIMLMIIANRQNKMKFHTNKFGLKERPLVIINLIPCLSKASACDVGALLNLQRPTIKKNRLIKGDYEQFHVTLQQ